MTKAEIFFNQMKNKKIAFIGTGVTNTNIIKLFLSKDFDLALQIASVLMQTEINGVINCCTGKAETIGSIAENFIKENHFCRINKFIAKISSHNFTV